MGQHSLAFCCVLPQRCDQIISIAYHSDDANTNQDTNTNMNIETNTNTNICGSAYIFPQHSLACGQFTPITDLSEANTHLDEYKYKYRNKYKYKYK